MQTNVLWHNKMLGLSTLLNKLVNDCIDLDMIAWKELHGLATMLLVTTNFFLLVL